MQTTRPYFSPADLSYIEFGDSPTPTPLTASQARAAMLAYHETRESALLGELEAKIEKSALKGYKTIDKPLKGYSPACLEAVVEVLGGRGFTVTATPFEDGFGVSLTVGW